MQQVELICAWCHAELADKQGGPDGYYPAWDWLACHKCFKELSSGAKDMRDKKV